MQFRMLVTLVPILLLMLPQHLQSSGEQMRSRVHWLIRRPMLHIQSRRQGEAAAQSEGAVRLLHMSTTRTIVSKTLKPKCCSTASQTCR